MNGIRVLVFAMMAVAAFAQGDPDYGSTTPDPWLDDGGNTTDDYKLYEVDDPTNGTTEVVLDYTTTSTPAPILATQLPPIPIPTPAPTPAPSALAGAGGLVSGVAAAVNNLTANILGLHNVANNVTATVGSNNGNNVKGTNIVVSLLSGLFGR